MADGQLTLRRGGDSGAPAFAARATVGAGLCGALAAAAVVSVGLAGGAPRWAGTLAVGAAALILAMLLLGRRAVTEARAAAAASGHRAAARDALIASTPAAFIAWAPGGAATVSPGFAAITGSADLGALLARLDRADAERLEAATEELRHRREPFVSIVRGPDCAFRVSARRPAAADPILWIEDVGALARARDAAEAEARRLADMLDALPVPVWQRRADLSLAYCNAAYAAIVERDPASALAQGVEMVAERDRAAARALAVRAHESGRLAAGDHHVVVGGARRLLKVNEAPLGAGTVGVAWDRTEVEEKTRELEQLIAGHAEALERLTTAIAIFGRDRQLIFFNSAYARLWGLDAEWLRGEPLHGEILEALRARRRIPEVPDFPAFKRRRDALFTELIEPLEEVLHRPDGRTLRSVVSPHPSGGLMFAYEDVTDKLALERSLNTLIAVQRATLDNLYEGVAVFGSDGRLKLSNPGFANLWQLDPARLEGEPHIADIVEATKALYDFGEDWQTFKAGVIAHTTDRTPTFDRLERRDGSVLEWSSVRLPDGATLMTYLDVTDSIMVERALRERAEALEEADHLKSEFIANVSYELRTPLNTIIGFSELLAAGFFGDLNTRQTEYVQGILDSSHQLLQLINDILDLASIEAGKMELDVVAFDLDAALASVVTLTDQRMRNADVALAFDCADGLGEIIGDERRIKQVVFHLLSNAIKFSPPGGKVVVEGRREGDEVVIAVSDSGDGIPADQQGRVFDKFWRGRQSAERPRGSGLGLSLVKSFVELHGGRVTVESAPGAGTRVVCRLPADARTASRAA